MGLPHAKDKISMSTRSKKATAAPSHNKRKAVQARKEASKAAPKATAGKRLDTMESSLDTVNRDMGEMKAMMASLVGLVRGDEQAAEPELEGEEALDPEPLPKRKKTVARPSGQATASLDEAEDIRAALKARLGDLHLQHEAPFATRLGGGDGYDEADLDLLGNQGKSKLLSGSVRTADCRAPKNFVLWPQEEGVYIEGGVPPKYEDLTVEQFVQGFITTALLAPPDELRPRLEHLEGLMADTQLRDWPKVRAFHRVWMQLIEQGRAQWRGSDRLRDTLKMRHVYMAGSPKAALAREGPTAATRKKTGRSGTRSPGKPLRPCTAFNSAKGCKQKPTHGSFKHCCSYCAEATGYHFKHAVMECRRKEEEERKN